MGATVERPTARHWVASEYELALQDMFRRLDGVVKVRLFAESEIREALVHIDPDLGDEWDTYHYD